ncbi:M14 family zinc carboxypeptidase [Kangiella koreensis]|uniref:Peptidase M14 carboxypeptidase A n=1 Tax=Kangiella koreensis (strain DSM 16069 / JCM 12317 / KCTC 12182 / SW-125) TaxID=523791 RepID=C7RD46_KANKD|nr:M14 family zinc carboxypeptidase [Kangiella koreensis]ACV27188.1 peptidase M14 carboxypeptidase A [Kangiella koreensis DSM 16069]
MVKLTGCMIASALVMGSTGVGAEVLSYTENTNSSNQLAIGYPVPIPVDSLTGVDGFRTYDSLHSQHQALAVTHAEVRSSVVGQTANNRDIYVYRFSDSDNHTVDGLPEPAFLINGTIHAREWQSPEVVTELMEQLTERKNDLSVVQYLLDNTNIVILPVLNIDGFLQTQRFPTEVTQSPGTNSSSTPSQKFAEPRDGRMRRKNMPNVDEVLSTESDRLQGVDLNRNGSVFFGVEPGNSSPSSLIYGGASAQSEAESEALLAAAQLGPRSRLRFYQDTHSFSRVLFVPQPSNSRLNTITKSLASKFQSTTKAQGADYFPVISQVGNGIPSTADYFAFTDLIPTWTLELEPPQGFANEPSGGAFYGGTGASHSGFIMPDGEIARTRDQLAPAQMLMLYHQAGPAYVTKVRLVDSEANDVYAAAWTSGSSRSLNVTTNNTLGGGQTYSLYVSFSKPMRVRNASGAISQYTGQSVTLAPSVSISGNGGSGNFTRTISVSRNHWLNEDVEGFTFDNYLDDAFKVDFTLPTDIPVSSNSGTTDLKINIGVQDLAGLALDADPRTAVDWSAGAWTNYENSNGQKGDSGGTDSSYSLKVSNQNLTLSEPQSSGGGGALHWLLLLLLSAFGLVRRPKS